MHTRVPIAEATDVAQARRLATALAAGLGFGEGDIGRVALVVTEAAGNLRKHARQGEVLLCVTERRGLAAVEVLALDHGPGIGDVGRALGDGYSTAGSPGTGLGAIRRLADEFELASGPAGTGVLARLFQGEAGRPAPPGRTTLVSGHVSVPKPGEQVCGDALAVRRTAWGMVVMVADGLGHGPDAAQAAGAAVAALRESADCGPAELLREVHERLRGTRGAAVSIAAIDEERRAVSFAGAGNVAAVLAAPGAAQHALVSLPGTAGYAVRRFQEFQYELPAAPSLLILASDGLTSRWTLEDYPGAFGRDPALVAGLLYKDHWRGTDDVTVLVVRHG
jgi:anti-sigma regulatory factor (Ser/Thr protein kinase)